MVEKYYNEYEFDLYIEFIESLKIENFNFARPTILSIMNENQMLAVKIEINNSCIVTCSARNITTSNLKAYYNDGSV
ncbi:hypothetical protein PS847_02253 [Pseudomonas fluorescens]|uniref:Uncharacterized protein n=1 Tax=Pseudomonas fluorescens TaxID=294 RepID=A0A5E7JPS0_PSEFL|nr:hypothetical protein [Pseudomonas koreensis]VVO89894.1 hypothetical protein PS847_02253 [Pseudomonas fluorescens]